MSKWRRRRVSRGIREGAGDGEYGRRRSKTRGEIRRNSDEKEMVEMR